MSYDQAVHEVTAFILAGGKSTRMGRDKAFMQLGKETLLSRALAKARSVAGEVSIVGDPKKFSSFDLVVPDVYRGRGPLAGIHAALMSTRTELNLMLAVDTPFISHQLLEFLLAKARNSKVVVTVPRTAGHLHPLCAVYRRDFAAACEQSLRTGHNKIDALFASVETAVIEEEELMRNGFHAQMFRNLNTPQDFEEAQLLYGLQEASQSEEMSETEKNS